MSKKLLIDGSRENQTQIALLIDEHLEDYEFESTSKKNTQNLFTGLVSFYQKKHLINVLLYITFVEL